MFSFWSSGTKKLLLLKFRKKILCIFGCAYALFLGMEGGDILWE